MLGVLNFFKKFVATEFFALMGVALRALPDSPLLKYAAYILKELGLIVELLFNDKNIGQAIEIVWEQSKAEIIGNTLETTRQTLDSKIHSDAVRKLVDDILTDLNGVLVTGNILPGTTLDKLYQLQAPSPQTPEV